MIVYVQNMGNVIRSIWGNPIARMNVGESILVPIYDKKITLMLISMPFLLKSGTLSTSQERIVNHVHLTTH